MRCVALTNKVTSRVAGRDKAEADKAIASAGDASYVQEGGDEQTSVMPCGQIAGLVKDIGSVREVLPEITTSVLSLCRELCMVFGAG